jgi:hypothetical protein
MNKQINKMEEIEHNLENVIGQLYQKPLEEWKLEIKPKIVIPEYTNGSSLDIHLSTVIYGYGKVILFARSWGREDSKQIHLDYIHPVYKNDTYSFQLSKSDKICVYGLLKNVLSRINKQVETLI